MEICPGFSNNSGSDKENATTDDHLLQLHSLLGPLPSSIAELWPRYNQYFASDGHQIRNLPIGADEDDIPFCQSLGECLFENRPEDMDEGEAEELVMMLSKMLKYDPAERMEAGELLKEPWLDAKRYI